MQQPITENPTAKIIEQLQQRLDHHTDHCIEHLLRIHYPESLANIDTAKIIDWPNEKNHLQEIDTGHQLGLISLGQQLRECSAAWKNSHSGWVLCDTGIEWIANTHQYKLRLQLKANTAQTQNSFNLALNAHTAEGHLLIQGLLQGQQQEISEKRKHILQWNGLGSSPERLLWPRSQAHPWYSALLEDFLCYPQASAVFKINTLLGKYDQEILNIRLPLCFNHTLPKPWRDPQWLESILIINPVIAAPWVEKAIQSFVLTPEQCNYSIYIQNQNTTSTTPIPKIHNISRHQQKNNHQTLLQIKQQNTTINDLQIEAWVQCQYQHNSPQYEWRLFNKVTHARRIFLTGLWTDAEPAKKSIHLKNLHQRWQHLQNAITTSHSKNFDWKNWLKSHCIYHHDMLNILLENLLCVSCQTTNYEQTYKGRQFLCYGQQLVIQAKSQLRFYISPNLLLHVLANYFAIQQTQMLPSQVVLHLIQLNEQEIFKSPWTLHPWNNQTI